MFENSVADLKKWFGTSEKPVTGPEMMAFWKSLTDEEKDEFRKAELG